MTLRGFKSFADRINLKFEPGITVIVGPNGSGKSNITDGALWALGEQRPTSLRGSSMEDVIFAGSATRPALGMAEVTVCLDNSDSYLPIEFSDVTITRRVFRSGESEYFINNSPCRLIDVQELLSDTSLGKEMYTIIGQGQLEELLSGKPEDRRLLIEEVAQVLKHKRRREKAVKKMQVMEYNLLRAKDVLVEVNRQLQPLREQSLRAQNHQKISEELKDLKIDLSVRELKELQEEWNSLSARDDELNTDLASVKEKITFQEERFQQLQIELEEKGLYAGDLDEQHQRLRSIYEKLNTGLLLLEEKGKNLIQRLSEIRQTVYQTESRKKHKLAEIERISDRQSALDSRLSVLLKKLADLRKKSEFIKKTWLDSEERFSGLEEEILTLRSDLMKKEDERSLLNLEFTEIEGKLAFLKKRREELKKAKLAAEKNIKKLMSGQAAAGKKKDQAIQAVQVLQAKINETNAKIDLDQKEIDGFQKKRAQVQTNLNILENLAQFYPTYPEFIAKALLEEKVKVVGVLADLLEVNHGYERAIERALGDCLFAVVVKDVAGATMLLALARGEGSRFIALFPLAEQQIKHPPKCCPDSGVSALEAISVPAEHQPLIHSLLGNVWIVKDLKAALKQKRIFPEFVFLTSDGEMIDEHGLITATAVSSDQPSVFSCHLEIEKRRRQQAEIESALNRKTSSVEKKRAHLKEFRDRLDSLRSEQAEKEHELTISVLEQASAREHLIRLSEEESQLNSEIEGLNERLAQGEEMSGAFRQEIKDLYEKIELYQVELGTVRKDKNIWSRKENEISKELNECQLEINSLNEKQKDLKQQLAGVEREIEEQDGLLAYEQKVVGALERLRARVQPVHDQYTHLLHFVNQKSQLINDLSADEKNISVSIKQLLKESQEEIRRLNHELEELTQKLSHLQLSKGQMEVKVSSAVQKIVDEYDLPLERALEIYPKDLPKADCEAKIKRLQSKLAGLGPVNPVAVEQFAQAEKRFEFLSSQIADLVESKKVLNRVITAIDKKIKEKFLETFEEVNVNFQKVFNFLFPGGRAELILLDPDDPLNSGVEIEAQPSGKKLKKLSLLSGGERALVALALLFAVHETRPSPFYILDEVEPALDDVNLQRFISLLKKMRQETQFLIISHQRRTMEIADTLYGVSMQADGVSKAFSQKLKTAKEAS